MKSDMKPDRGENTRALKASYDVECAVCGHPQQAAPSLSMLIFGINSGAGTCGKCQAYLHLEITPDLGGDRMSSMEWDEWYEREMKELSQAADGGHE